uniref:Uncharacterized protein n=1 Tax=Panagrolaimus superbus TaxID=310955 RepID=A0A914YGE6_9BILA
MANRLIDNVVDTVGGHYAAAKKSKATKITKVSESSSSEEQIENFRKALRNENVTRLQYHQPLSDFKRKDSKETITEVALDINNPSRQRIQYAYRDGNILSSAEIVHPKKYPSTLSPTAAYPPQTTIPTTSTYSAPTEFGVLPSLLMRNPNARSKFYHLDKYANPQHPPGIKRKVFRPPLNPLPEYIHDSEFYRIPPKTSEIRRKPIARISSSTYYQNSQQESRDQKIYKEIKFRSALKQILADFRKQHPSSFLHSNSNNKRLRELSQIAQQEGSKSNRRRRPQSRRIVHLPSRYDFSEEQYRRW